MMRNDANRRTALVSGANGFIGHNLIKSLIMDNWNVVALVRNAKKFLDDFTSPKINNLAVIEADLSDIDTLKTIDKQIYEPCCLLHLGGYILKGSENVGAYDAIRSIDTNIKGSYNLIKLLKPKLKYACIVSTLDVYGIPKYLPLNEEHPVSPTTFYAASKLAMELYTAIELRETIPLAILRLSHVYGHCDPHPKVLQLFVNNICVGKNPIIYGDGSDLRDYVHVRDVVEAIIKCVSIKAQGIFNIATGKSFSLKEMAEIAIKCSGKELEPISKERRKPRIDYSFDITKLRSELYFSPRISIEDGIKGLLNAAKPIQTKYNIH